MPSSGRFENDDKMLEKKIIDGWMDRFENFICGAPLLHAFIILRECEKFVFVVR